METRTPAVAGMFYPSEKKELEESIEKSFMHIFGPGHLPPKKNDKRIYGVICPHAGYMYSGPVACHSFYEISGYEPELFVIIGPNHWGIGRNVATMKECDWETPLGKVEVDSDAAEKLTSLTGFIDIDFFSHTKEHSLEVQVPMLQQVFKNFKILPIALIDQSKETAIKLGRALAILANTKNMMIIGSSDFTHYEQNDFAYEQDHALIEPILELDLDRFYKVLEERRVSSCGYGAIASTMVACKELGATKGELIKYATSGDVMGDKSSVVGYGSIVFI